MAAHKALEQYVERRCSLSKLVSSLECCFLERSHQEGSKMGTIFCQVAQSFAKDMIYPKYVLCVKHGHGSFGNKKYYLGRKVKNG